MFTDHKMWLQDVPEAYIQGTYLQLDVYLKLGDQFILPQDIYLKLLKHIYGLSESGD